jgi:hypothetical protein
VTRRSRRSCHTRWLTGRASLRRRGVLVETKGVFPHNDADAALRQLGLRPVSMSKYCISVALLFPGVRSNPWHRTLRRYFAGTFGEPATY